MALLLEKLQLPRDHFTVHMDADVTADVTGVFGSSGAGKTSLMHLVAGLARPTAGRIVFNDRVLVDVERRVWVPPWKRRIGMVFQEARLFPHLSVKNNLLFGARQRSSSGTRSLFDEIVAMLELGKLLGSRPARISGGEAQRVALGRALLSSPQLLLLDEPFSAVDVARRRHILPFLWRVRSVLRIPMLVISHELTDLLQLTPHLLLIDRGRVAGHGRIEELVFDSDAFGLIKNSGMVNVLDLEVGGNEDSDTLILRNGNAATPLFATYRSGLVPGQRVRATIAPEDIVLTKTPVDDTSARNVIPGRVIRVVESPGRSLCRVDIGGGNVLLAELTRNSFVRLGLEPGMTVYCLFKATVVALTVLEPGGTE